VRRFAHGGQQGWQLLEEYELLLQTGLQHHTGSHELRASNVFGRGIDEIIRTDVHVDHDGISDDVWYFHADDLGSIYVVTDADGAVLERYEYSDFGEVAVLQPNGNIKSPAEWIGNRFTYVGRPTDFELGLIQMRHRYMAPTIGRFIQRDKLGYIDGMNMYTYVYNQPLTYNDPSGLAKCRSLDRREKFEFKTGLWKLRIRVAGEIIYKGSRCSIPCGSNNTPCNANHSGRGTKLSLSTTARGRARLIAPIPIGQIPPGLIDFTVSGSYGVQAKVTRNSCTGAYNATKCMKLRITAGLQGEKNLWFVKATVRGELFYERYDCNGDVKNCFGGEVYVEFCKRRRAKRNPKGCWRATLYRVDTCN
jgi:RHS repeat-associated protein